MLKGDAAGDASIVRRVSAAQIEVAVMSQVRALLRQPEIVVGTRRAARKEARAWQCEPSASPGQR